MHCFSLAERVVFGIAIARTAEDDYPHIPVPEGCPFMLMLDRELTELAERVPADRALWLDQADVGFEQGVLVLKTAREGGSREALVRVETAGGDGGRVFLSANVYTEEFVKGCVKWTYQQFPPLGINALAEAAYLDKVYDEGVEMLDLLIIMKPGASFRVHRTGRLEGASPDIMVQWTGSRLQARLPKRYDAREPRLAVLGTG